MTNYIALVADRAGLYVHVYGSAPNWKQFSKQLEDAGCEVIENQTEEWSDCTKDEIAEDCFTIHQLLSFTPFVPYA